VLVSLVQLVLLEKLNIYRAIHDLIESVLGFRRSKSVEISPSPATYVTTFISSTSGVVKNSALA
jgi:hypothetical protein